MIYTVDFRGAAIGGPVVPGRMIAGREKDLTNEPRVTFLLHGFNVDRKEGETQLRKLASGLARTTQGAFIATLWPGDSWLGALSYPFEGSKADDSAEQLMWYIFQTLRPGTPICFITHSLGARVDVPPKN